MSNITRLADFSGESRHVSVEELLENAMESLNGTPYESPDGAIILFVKKTDGVFGVHYDCAKMKNHERLAALQMVNAMVLQDMGVIPNGED